MSSWFDSSSTLSDQVEDEKFEAQQDYLPECTRRQCLPLWDEFHGRWPYQPLDGSSDVASSVGPQHIKAHFRESFLACGGTLYDFDRSPMVEYKDLIKIPVRKLPKHAGHIVGVLGGFCRLRWRGILRQTSHAVDPQDPGATDGAYTLLQLPCNDDTFNWLWGVMESIELSGARPQLLAAPVIPGVIEVLANENIPLPAEFRKPDVLPHGILSRQVAFHCKDRAPYREIISSTLSNPNRIIKDMMESFALTPCRWSVVDCEITYHSPC
ncbi:MAG: hypothetical protein LQ346_005348 [Caloplaca aetnensis]|nr:MAG: hypothetical protein LQ346_005348 [Caloplaca aetnensis]